MGDIIKQTRRAAQQPRDVSLRRSFLPHVERSLMSNPRVFREASFVHNL